MKLGILGGTFNPIHTGHLIMAETSRVRCALTKILFIPCHLPYHKQAVKLAAPPHRLAMARLAAAGNPHFAVSDMEIRRGGLTYSIDTLRALRKIYPAGTGFYFIIGRDSLPELPLWREIRTLAKLCRFIVVNRPKTRTIRLPAFLHRRVLYLDGPLIDISSSDIRQRISRRQSIKYLVPLAVEKYILKHRLYR